MKSLLADYNVKMLLQIDVSHENRQEVLVFLSHFITFASHQLS